MRHHAMRMAAAAPAVPGPNGKCPHPNHVASATATRSDGLVVILIRGLVSLTLLRLFGIQRLRDDVTLRSPVAKVDQTATIAAKGSELRGQGNFLAADGT